MNDIRKVLSYNDVLLCPRNSELEHISDADIAIFYDTFVGTSYPIINAPMTKVCSPELIHFLSHNGCPTTIHRWFDSPEEQIAFFEKCKPADYGHGCFLSVGILAKWQSWIDKLIEYKEDDHTWGCFGFLVDVANGDTKAVVDTVKYLEKNIGHHDTSIMAGNVATRSGFARLQDAGANYIRVGIGGGSICSTRLNTGFGIPTLTSVFDCAKVKDTAYLVADGGIENAGDICKAMAAGADMVMLGKMLAATSMSGGEKHTINDKRFVEYSGMASKEAIYKLKSKKSVVSIEGVSGLIPYVGETEDVLKELIGNLQSAVSYYAGCRDWKEFRRKVKFLEISQQGWEESKTRVNL